MSTSPESAPHVSVALPVCNNERFLGDAVRSILNQTLPPREVVIGDDGSQDGTSALLSELARENASIKVLRRDRRSGLANAANWVISNTSADLVALAHGDDLSHPDRLARQVAALVRCPEAVLVGAPATGIDEAGRQIHPANLWRLVRPTAFAPFAHSSIMFRRQAFLDAGGYRFESDYWEDLDLYWRMARLGRMLALSGAVSSYRYSADSFRSRDREAEVEQAINYMYQCAGQAGAGHVAAALDRRATRPTGKVRPRVFIAQSWTKIWRAQRPGMWLRLVRHARMRADRETLLALCFVGGGTIAPRLFRKILQGAARLRNRMARRLLGDRLWVEWRPFGPESQGGPSDRSA
jgi:glycosyltransferase involved in cell wall biosynthesis